MTTSAKKRTLTPEQAALAAKAVNGVSLTAFFIVLTLVSVLAIVLDTQTAAPDLAIALVVIVGMLIAIYLLFAIKVADQWEKAVALRFGRFRGLKGPGLFWVIPIVDSVRTWIDHRVMVTPFNAEKTLTKDTVPVDVDAVLFWMVWDAEKTALEVENYKAAIAWAAQTALREVIGQMELADILVGRAKMDADLQRIIDARTNPWGITVQSVEIRDIVIPEALEDAMSRRAQAERERQARVILGEPEKQIAESFREASLAYQENPVALHLRAMNMLFEGLKEKGALVIVPSGAVETMNLGGLLATTALAQNAPGKPIAYRRGRKERRHDPLGISRAGIKSGWGAQLKAKHEEELNTLGQEGWELAGMAAEGTAMRLVFKRPIGEARPVRREARGWPSW